MWMVLVDSKFPSMPTYLTFVIVVKQGPQGNACKLNCF